MHPKLPLKIAAGAGALVLAGTMVAAAADAPPDAADQGLTTASEHSGLDVPVRSGGAPAPDDASTDEAVDAEVEALEATDDEPAVTADDEVDAQDAGDHGAAVSAVASAKDPETPGRDHGEAVSTIAQQNGQGGERSASARDGQDETEEEDVTADATEDDDEDDAEG